MTQMPDLAKQEQSVALALHASKPREYSSPVERLLWYEIVRQVRDAMFPGHKPSGMRNIDRKAWTFGIVSGFYGES